MRRWYNEVGFQLEVADRIQVYDCVKNNNNGMYEITTKTRTFYYDEDRRMLLGE